MDLVSFVVPVYNVEPYLEECVESILNQTWPALEVILVDDGSPDQCPAICDAYAARDHRVKVIHKRNGGLSSARNAGLALATGKYLWFIDSDDRISPDAAELLVQYARQEKAEMVFFDRDVFYTDYVPQNSKMRERSKAYPTRPGREQLAELFRNEDFIACAPYLFFLREYFLKSGLSFQEGIVHEDELFTFLAFEADGMTAHLDKKLYHVRRRPDSIMTSGTTIRNFSSMVSIYYEAVRRYDAGQISGEAADLGMARFARMALLSKFPALTAEEQAACRDVVKNMQRNILRHHGYGDIKLKIKCSTGFRKLLYRLEYKLSRRT